MTVLVTSADLHEALNKIWDDSGIDTEFKSFWKIVDYRDEFPSLHDQMAGPSQPFPYCVYEQEPGVVTARMTSATATGRREIRDIPVIFRIHATGQNNVTAKKICAELAEKILSVYGGHPTITPRSLVLNYGNFLIAQYQNDYGIRTGDEEYQWNIMYLMRLDIPVAA
jgi:hypothetical protein